MGSRTREADSGLEMPTLKESGGRNATAGSDGPGRRVHSKTTVKSLCALRCTIGEGITHQATIPNDLVPKN
jgi:hypothetical protein